MNRSIELRRLTALTQGLVYLITGAWPIVHLRSFMAVTGPKRDGWLVKSTGGLIAAIGTVLLLAAGRGRPEPEIVLLGAASAVALGTADTVYGGRHVISRIYLLDACVEAGFVAAWIRTARQP